MTIDITIIQTLRAKTGAGVADCKAVLEETNGDVAGAEKLLRERGAIKAAKRTDKETNEGVITSYIHAGGKVGVLLMLTCETDFVARDEKFQTLARELAMQVAATDPLCIRPEDVPAGNEEADEEVCLLKQKYIKNEELTIEQLINEHVASLGERIEVKRFARFGLGGGNRSCGV